MRNDAHFAGSGRRIGQGRHRSGSDDLRTLAPLIPTRYRIREKRRTGALVVHEDTKTGGIAREDRGVTL